MRKLITLFVAVLIMASVSAQSPETMSYQAVIRDATNMLVTNHAVGMRISILQGSATGTEAYTEVYNPNPQANANGLVTIEIGSGIPLTGEFATIDWVNGPYFVKTETDPAGGTNYTITGTSQLLSVPYALHAKMAENGITPAQVAIVEATSGTNTGDQNISGIVTNATEITTLQTEQATQNTAIAANTAKISYPAADATKLAGIFTGAEVNVQADWNTISNKADDFIKNKPIIPTAADGSETKLTSGTNITVTGIGTSASPYVVNETGPTNLAVGQSYQGGIIFYLTPNKQHGLIVETIDQATATKWDDAQSRISMPYEHSTEGKNYTDWRLPTFYELAILYNLRDVLIGYSLSDDWYWSSTRFSESDAFIHIVHFGTGEQEQMGRISALHIRSIRSF